MDYLKSPTAIYQLSKIRVKEALIDQGVSSPSPALVRMVHACADPSIADDFRASPKAENFGKQALAEGASVLCDCEMVKHGIVQSRLPAQNALKCYLNHLETRHITEKQHTTRSAAAVELWRESLPDSIVLIGNAPTTLFALLELIAKENLRPKLIIGMPVGFVGAAESKQALIDRAGDIPYLTLLGKRGGSAIAAAAMNSLAGDLGS